MIPWTRIPYAYIYIVYMLSFKRWFKLHYGPTSRSLAGIRRCASVDIVLERSHIHTFSESVCLNIYSNCLLLDSRSMSPESSFHCRTT